MNERIEKVWFGEGFIWIDTGEGQTKRLPLEMFPALMMASDELRMDFYIWDDGRSIRWDKIDEDVHISNFDNTMTPNYDNEVNRLFDKMPCIDIKAFAELLDMHWVRLALMRYGIIPASDETIFRIKMAMKQVAEEMSAAV